ncbi:type VI secretion system protein TssA [Vibrio sp. ZSDE26]|uniref:Type VI secretion system protein TssA n=1 Tax=Vibrio amylolyticus TaxID=2847292 RepID=A0A9X2BHZ6_9VIBR|nr:type VI secretion system protein TssA [Vibrio amylolyticus]MCK6263555.1 type VI secretion system protein TssA [Vibrio amylolyticus]
MSLIDIDSLLEPISESLPSGEDARYEFCYEMMEAEIKKFGSLFGETVDWKVVQDYAVEVLSSHSKDLKAICYLIRALVEDSKLEGLNQGLSLLLGAFIRYGSDLFPNRKRGRDGAIEWLNQQLKTPINAMSDNVTSWSDVSSCQDLLSKVQCQFDGVYHDSEADFFEIKSALNALSQRVGVQDESTGTDLEPLKDAQGNVETSSREVLSQTMGSASQDGSGNKQSESVNAPSRKQERVNDDSSEARLPEKAHVNRGDEKNTIATKPSSTIDLDTDFSSPSASKKTLKSVAENLISSNIGLPLAYRIFRHLTWFDIDSLPEHKENMTPLSLAISQDQQNDYQDKAHNNSDIETIKRLERTLTDAPFWLTGHYFVYQMLCNLGHKVAADAVKKEVNAFVDALPNITKLSFKNSIPFADEATINWLSSTSSEQNTYSQSLVRVESDEEAMQMEDITLTNLGDYAAKIAQQLDQDVSGRGQFRLLIQMVQVYQAVGMYSLCLPYLDKLWVIQKEIHLSSWEPHLYFQVESLFRTTLTALYVTSEQLPVKYQEWKTIYN